MVGQTHHCDVDAEDALLPVLDEDPLLQGQGFRQALEPAEVVLQFHDAELPSVVGVSACAED
jgi:hypothetical protein